MGIRIHYDYGDVPTIRRFALSDKFIRGLMGPFGSGKSSGCVMEIFRRAKLQAPGLDGIRRSRFVAIRNTYRQLQDTTIKTFHDWFPPQYFGKWRGQDHDYIITNVKGCQIEILFRALDRPDQVSNLLSLEVTGAWLNEAREVPKAIFEAIQGRVGRYPAVKDGGCTWAGVILDTNPPDTDSWWYQLFEESRAVSGHVCSKCDQPAYHVFNRNTDFEQAFCQKHTNIALFKQPSGLSLRAENKTKLREGYYDNLAAGKDPEYIKVYIHGQYGFVRDGKPVYPEYADHVHCQEVKPLPASPMYVGLDFGLTPAAVFCQISHNGQLLVVDEFCSEDMGVERFADNLIRYINQHYKDYVFEYFGDPAGNQKAQTDERTCFGILAAKNIFVTPGEQDLTMRLESVRKPINSMVNGKPGFLMSPRCRMLRKGFQGEYKYRRLQVSQERYTDQPEKNQYSHPHDALQYACTRLFGQRLLTGDDIYKPRNRYSKSQPASNWKVA